MARSGVYLKIISQTRHAGSSKLTEIDSKLAKYLVRESDIIEKGMGLHPRDFSMGLVQWVTRVEKEEISLDT